MLIGKHKRKVRPFDEVWRLFGEDIEMPCASDNCPARLVAWRHCGRYYCDTCAQRIRDVSDRLSEAAK